MANVERREGGGPDFEICGKIKWRYIETIDKLRKYITQSDMRGSGIVMPN